MSPTISGEGNNLLIEPGVPPLPLSWKHPPSLFSKVVSNKGAKKMFTEEKFATSFSYTLGGGIGLVILVILAGLLTMAAKAAGLIT